MANLSPRMIEDLKAAGHFFAAGAVAKALGGTRFYGCHLGMRSTKAASEAEFLRGYDANPDAAPVFGAWENNLRP